MSHTNDMTKGNPMQQIISFALPLIVGYILQQMYLIIDASIVGRFIGVEALAAVGASTSVMFIVMGFCGGTCAGFSIPIAQTYGAKDFSKMRAYVANALRISLVIAIIITLLTSIFCEQILHLVNTPEDVMRQAWIFLIFQFVAIPFMIAYNLLSGFIRALGNSKQPFYFLITSSVVNIILDLILILIFKMGVAGAGLATLLSQLFAAALCARYILRELKMLIPRDTERRYNDKMVGKLLMNGIPMGLQFSITGIGVMMLQSANNALGTIYVASFTASVRIKYLFTTVFDNIGVAMATYCGQNIGAGQMKRISQGIRSAIKIMLIYFVMTFLVIWPFADKMMMFFVDAGQQEIISNAALFMRIANYFYPALGLLTILRYSIQGLGYSNLSMMSGVMEMLARCSVSIWLVPFFHFLGVCYGDPMAWIAADLFLIPAYIWVYRRLCKVHMS